MDKVLVVIFDNESKAYEGSLAMQELQNEGSINLYAKAVIAKDTDGKVTVKQEGDMGPVGTAVGLLTGTLLGMFAGPIGLALGASAGTSGGILYDLVQLGVGEDFVQGVGQSLKPGNAAVVAEVWEEWMLPVDSKMEALGGVVFRRTRSDVLDQQVEADITSLKADIDALEAEYSQANAEAKTKIQAKINKANAMLQTKLEVIKARLETSQKETEAKIQSLQDQATKAGGERKTKIEKRIAELQADQKRRSELLKQAGELIKDALTV